MRLPLFTLSGSLISWGCECTFGGSVGIETDESTGSTNYSLVRIMKLGEGKLPLLLMLDQLDQFLVLHHPII